MNNFDTANGNSQQYSQQYSNNYMNMKVAGQSFSSGYESLTCAHNRQLLATNYHFVSISVYANPINYESGLIGNGAPRVTFQLPPMNTSSYYSAEVGNDCSIVCH